MSDLVKRLQIKAAMIDAGERIQWGSDSSIMNEAADRIEQLDRQLAAEKALADALYEAARNYRVSAFNARDKSFIDSHAAYRKARGL